MYVKRCQYSICIRSIKMKTNTEISFSFRLTLFYSIPLLALTHRQMDRQTEKWIYPGWAGHPDGFLQVYPGCAGRTLTGSSRLNLTVKLLRINIGNRVKMWTPVITLWFPEQSLLGFFILEKQLASHNMFLIRSELSITAYLFLVLYRSTSLQSLSFLKNIKTFLCK